MPAFAETCSRAAILAEPLSFDLYVANSQEATGLAPVVVLIHGSPISPDWVTRPRLWRAFQSIGEVLAASELLTHGLTLTFFDEPQPRSGDADQHRRYRRAPWFIVMEWQRPG